MIQSPYIFDTLSLPKEGLYDSLLQDRGVFGFLDMTYDCETDSCRALSLFMGGLGFVDSVSTDLQTIWIRNERNFNYFTNYGLMYSNIFVVDTSTSNIFEIDTLMPSIFQTIQKPLKFTGTSFQSIPLTCKDNSFLVNFNIPLTQFQGENGYIVTVDTVQFVNDTIPNVKKPVFYPINTNLQLHNNNRSLLITKEWGISTYLEIAMAIFKIGGLICQMDQDDYLGSQGLVLERKDFWKGDDNKELRDHNYNSKNLYEYFPMYIEHYYKQSKGSVDFYFRKILY